jgi:hypothetical protein
MKEMNKFGLEHIYKWKYHKETPCVAIFKKQKCHFSFFYKIGEQDGKTGPAWAGGVPMGGGRRWGKDMEGLI